MKRYIVPSTKCVELSTENLIATSIDKGSGTITDENQILTNKQDQQGGNSLWDTWSN